MKYFYVFMIVFLLAGGVLSVSAQDLLNLKDGSVIEAKVTEISLTEIRYKRYNHLDGPVIVISAERVQSIKYENGTLEVITSSAATVAVTGLPSILQSVLNVMPAIPIAGNYLKFEFNGDRWTARVNGQNFSAGILKFEEKRGGCILTLQQTHIWPGAVGRTAGRIAGMIPGGAAVGGALNTAGTVAGAIGAVEAYGPEIVLEYKEGPPSSLSVITVRGNVSEDTVKEPKELRKKSDDRLYTVGGSIGTTTGPAPMLTVTVQTAYAFFDYTFFEGGLDVGFFTTTNDNTKYQYTDYFSLYPFINFCLFVPYNRGGWYVGAGYGVMFAYYVFNYGLLQIDKWVTTHAINLTTGFIIWDWFNITYTQRFGIREDGYTGTNGKFSMGYVWRY